MGLPLILGQLLHYQNKDVEPLACQLFRTCLIYAPSLSTCDQLLLGTPQVMDEACRIGERGLAQSDPDAMCACLSLLAECISSTSSNSSHILLPSLPRVSTLIASICKDPRKNLAVLPEMTTLLRNAALYLDPSSALQLLQNGPALHSLPLLRLSTPTASMALDLITVVAERLGKTIGTSFLQDIKAITAIMDAIMGGDGHEETKPHLKISLLRALRTIILSDPDVFLPLLRSPSTSTEAWKARLEALASDDPNYKWLAAVVNGADPLVTPITYTSWIDMAAYHRSVVESKWHLYNH